MKPVANSNPAPKAPVYFKGAWVLISQTAQAVKELLYGIRYNTVPWAICSSFGILESVLICKHWDFTLFKLCRLQSIYPFGANTYRFYCFFAVTGGLWFWAAVQTVLRVKLMRRLKEVFINCGLKTNMGRIPAYISNTALDQYTQKLRLNNVGIPKYQFEKVKDDIGTNLQVFIDDLKENRREGTIDIVYSSEAMPESATIMGSATQFPRFQFIAGSIRRGFLIENLKDVPHLLIAGQSGGGKSTFLRQLITILFLNNKNCQFTLIDLKGGLEFQIFENLPRVQVIPDLPRAVRNLERFEEALKSRMALLKANGCKDLDAYLALPEEKRKPCPEFKSQGLDRHIIVVDEAAEIFLAGGGGSPQEIQKAKRVLSQVARQGRAVGIHLVIATQRPDTKSLDSQVKANLTGILCFPMPNDASSMTVLGNGRATDLPSDIKGRAIWKKNGEMTEVQTPFLSVDETESLLSEFRTKKPEAPQAPSSMETNSLDASTSDGTPAVTAPSLDGDKDQLDLVIEKKKGDSENETL
jgi:S-DNA-T family DNA segregation ATPase FtsK/SpoIIIE